MPRFFAASLQRHGSILVGRWPRKEVQVGVVVLFEVKVQLVLLLTRKLREECFIARVVALQSFVAFFCVVFAFGRNQSMDEEEKYAERDEPAEDSESKGHSFHQRLRRILQPHIYRLMVRTQEGPIRWNLRPRLFLDEPVNPHL